ncbi:MAG: ABC transporter permease [Desulfobulbus sp.]|nr:MAG: ABC transporter permease [Desulfobulbus sp.]RUM40783.1 MAG: ABC transporter permease [Desulfobulbus sp.]
MKPVNAFLRVRGLLGIAMGSLMKHRLRSLLSVLGIICGVAAVFAILSIGEGAKREVLAGISQLGLDNIIVRSIGSSEKRKADMKSHSAGLALEDVALLSKVPVSVKAVAYLKDIQAAVTGASRELSPQLVACSFNYLQLLGFIPSSGRLFVARDEHRKNMVCVLGATLARHLGSFGRVGTRLKIDEQIYLVVGIIQGNPPQDRKKSGAVVAREINDILFIPFGSHVYLNKQGSFGKGDELDEIIIKFSGRTPIESVLPLVKRTLDLSRHGVEDYQLIVPRQLLRQARKTQRIFNMVLGTIGGISLVVGGIGIMNVLLATVSERTREIGIRRAVGASREDILAQFLAESVLLTTAGGVIGLAVGVFCSWLIARFAGWSVAVTLYGILVPLLTSVAVGICFGLFPALKAAGMDPVQALRSA